VLVDLAFGAEDCMSDAALFAPVAGAYRNPELRSEAHGMVTGRPVTIGDSFASLMRVVAKAAGARDCAGTEPSVVAAEALTTC
jgi:hypothetical protein